jgi:hypothetical protein
VSDAQFFLVAFCRAHYFSVTGHFAPFFLFVCVSGAQLFPCAAASRRLFFFACSHAASCLFPRGARRALFEDTLLTGHFLPVARSDFFWTFAPVRPLLPVRSSCLFCMKTGLAQIFFTGLARPTPCTCRLQRPVFSPAQFFFYFFICMQSAASGHFSLRSRRFFFLAVHAEALPFSCLFKRVENLFWSPGSLSLHAYVRVAHFFVQSLPAAARKFEFFPLLFLVL